MSAPCCAMRLATLSRPRRSPFETKSDDRGSDADLDSERAEHWGQYTRPLPVRRRLSYALAGALAAWAMPNPAQLPRAALNRGGAAPRGSPSMPPSDDTI